MGLTFDSVLGELRTLFILLESRVPPPQKVPWGDSFVFRYPDKTLEQALIQKFARVLSGLSAALVLLDAGYTQELGTLQRCLDDFDGEIRFLALAALTQTRSEVHERFLAGFYSEDLENLDDVVASLTKKRPSVSRKEIREATESSIAAMSAAGGVELESGTQEGRAISALYNGFAHAGSPQVLEMYGGDPPHYHIEGLLGTPRIQEHARDLWNQFYRASLSTVLIAYALGDMEVSRRASRLSRRLGPQMGLDEGAGTAS